MRLLSQPCQTALPEAITMKANPPSIFRSTTSHLLDSIRRIRFNGLSALLK